MAAVTISWPPPPPSVPIPAPAGVATSTAIDFVTVLTTRGPIATKQITRLASGEYLSKPYGNAKFFRIDRFSVASFQNLINGIYYHQQMSRRFLVRGQPVNGRGYEHATRRVRERRNSSGEVEPATLAPAEHHYMALDIDGISCPPHIDPIFEPDQVVEYVVSLLPPEFHDATCFWQFTSSHGLKNGRIHMRLWFWSDRLLADWQLKQWLRGADAPVDTSIFDPVQAIYIASPVFTNCPDPLPVRCGVWQGDRDEITPPAIEKPKVHARAVAVVADERDHGGGGYEYYKRLIGDQKGQRGFFSPIKSAVGAYFHREGAAADKAWLRADLEAATRAAPFDPQKRNGDYIEIRVTDLVPLIDAVGDLQVRREAERYSEEPTYALATGSIEAARAELSRVVKLFVENRQGRFRHSRILRGDIPVWGIFGPTGLGKSLEIVGSLAPILLAAGEIFILAVPTHRLGEEMVREFAKAGIRAQCYYGREANDPNVPEVKMCRDLPRINLIDEALGDPSINACKKGNDICEHYDVCGYQWQRQQQPQIWIIPHHLLFHERPAHIPQPNAVAIDESFEDAALPKKGLVLDLELLIRRPPRLGKPTGDDLELMEISRKAYAALTTLPRGRIKKQALIDAGLSSDDLQTACRLEWRRKKEVTAIPGMPIEDVKRLCQAVATHNQDVKALAQFWTLAISTLESSAKRSIWMTYNPETVIGRATAPGITMKWMRKIDQSWEAATLLLNATPSEPIIKQFFPELISYPITARVSQHVWTRQITDKAMTANMLIPTKGASDATNAPRLNNVERIRRFIEVRANDVYPGKVLVICQQGLENELREGRTLPANIELAHFNAVAGLNAFGDVALLVVIGRTEPSAGTVEELARLYFEREGAEVARYPLVDRSIRLRDGRGVTVAGPQHPDEGAEEVRRHACEDGLMQAVGRSRALNRGPDNPLQIDLLTCVVTALEVDEVTTWEAIQPTLAEVMRARGAVPVAYADMATAYPDLFPSGDAARMALRRENPEQIPIEYMLMGVCSGFRSIRYRRVGSRGPAGTLLYDHARIDPEAWLTERLGCAVTILEDRDPLGAVAAWPNSAY